VKTPDSQAQKKPEVVQRVQQLLQHYGLNASSATQKLGYSTTSKLYNILKGSEPSYPTLVDFLKLWPEVSAEWLMLGQGPMLHGEGDSVPAGRKSGSSVINSGQVLAITVDGQGNENTELVPIQAQAGYSVQHNEAVFLSDLPKYRIPGFERGTFRAFEVAGDSMEPTINHADVVVGSFVDNWRLLVPDDIYVVVTSESIMLKRIRERITSHDMTIMLYSDNYHRKPYPMEASDIVELWRVRGYITSYIPSTPNITMERLWEVIETLGFDRGEVRRHLEENAPSDAPR